MSDYLDEAIRIVDGLEGSALYDYVAGLIERIEMLERRPRTKKTRHGKSWHYNCPECGVSEDMCPQLNFKNRCCPHCGWNNIGMSREMLIRSYKKSRS